MPVPPVHKAHSERGQQIRRGGRRRLVGLTVILVAACLTITGSMQYALYRVHFKGTLAQLTAIVHTQAHLIEAIALSERNASPLIQDQIPEFDADSAALARVESAYLGFEGFGRTGDILLGYRVDDSIVFRFGTRSAKHDPPSPVSMHAHVAEPMRRALSGESGTMSGIDYRGEMVIAAYEPVSETGYALVAKIDLAEVRGPFLRTAGTAGVILVVVLVIGSLAIWGITIPTVRHLEEQTRELSNEIMLRERSETRYRNLFWVVTDAIVVFDAENRQFVAVNETTLQMLGYTHDEFLNLRVEDISAEPSKTLIAVAQVARGELTRIPLRYYIRKDGTIFPVDVSATRFEWDGRPVICAIVRDITERIATEKQLEEQRTLLSSVLSQIPHGVFWKDHEGSYLGCNGQFAEMMGLPNPGAVCGLTDNDLPLSAHQRTLYEQLERDVITQDRSILNAEETKRSSKGEDMHMLSSRVPLRDSKGRITGILGICTDITDHKHAEEELSRSKRLEFAGRLAAQIAHDFNNLLGPLAAYPSLLRAGGQSPEEVNEMLGEIENNSRQIADINQELVTLGRRGHISVETLSINDVIAIQLNVLRAPDGVRIEADLAEDILPIEGASGQLTRVINNLLVNAMEAVSDGGTICIRSQNTRLDQFAGPRRTIPPGEYVVVCISDDGPGISKDVLARMWEPFFTTKTTDRSRGSGLGLSVVQAVIEDHGGFVDVETTVGKGTTFRLYFPPDYIGTASKETGSGAHRGNGERILVVDDDPAQQRVARRALESMNYRVTTVSSGEAAVTLIRKQPHDLVILDMVMEGIDGTETLRQIKELYPTQRALILSGYAANERVEAAMELAARGFIAKPIRVDTLARAVAAVFESDGNAEQSAVADASQEC